MAEKARTVVALANAPLFRLFLHVANRPDSHGTRVGCLTTFARRSRGTSIDTKRVGVHNLSLAR